MLGDRMSQACAVFTDAFEREVGRPLGLRRHEYMVLRTVHDRPGITSAEVARDMGVSRPYITKIVDELQRRRLVTRTTVLRDRRAQCLELSAVGSELAERATSLTLGTEQVLLANWTIDEQQRLFDLLGRLVSPEPMRQRTSQLSSSAVGQGITHRPLT
jgi:DNA-binding MarR family transcriptional regulator